MQIFQLLGIFVSKRISNGFIWIYPTYFKLLSYFNIVIFTFSHNPLGYTTIKSFVCYDFHGCSLWLRFGFFYLQQDVGYFLF